MKGLDDLMKQAQEMQKKMQQQMEEQKEQQKNILFKGQSGAGLVKVEINGAFAVKSLKLDPSLLKEQQDMIEDLITAAMNDALKKVLDNQSQGIQGLGEGLDLKDFKFPF